MADLETASAGGEDLRRGLLEPRPQPLPALLRLLVALTRNAKKLPVANRLGQDDPLDLRLLRRQVELLQVAEEEQPRQLRAPEDLGALVPQRFDGSERSRPRLVP